MVSQTNSRLNSITLKGNEVIKIQLKACFTKPLISYFNMTPLISDNAFVYGPIYY
jgi:hypothetical protein